MLLNDTDINLINRAIRHIHTSAKIELALSDLGRQSTPESKKAKRRYDRLTRDERDLRMLRNRLETGA